MRFGLKRATAAEADARRAMRQDVEIDTSMLLPIGDRHQVRIVNLSSSGFLMTSPIPLQPGQVFRINLGGVRLRHARVARVDGERYGCQFLGAIDTNDVMTAHED